MKEGVLSIYFSLKNGVMRRVSREVWEAEWLKWWESRSIKELA